MSFKKYLKVVNNVYKYKNMYLLILFLPLLGSITAGLFGRKLGSSGAQLSSIVCLGSAAVLALISFYEIAICNSPVSINLGSWINSDILTINWLFYFDQLTVTMLVIVSVVSLAVHIYSIYYMTGEPHQQRFFSYLSLFTFFMLVLVSGGNYLVLFLGWEGIGVSSYLLINYYYTRLASNKAAILAFNQNRVGDWILSVGFFAIIAIIGSLDFDVVFSLAPSINPNLITLICVLLFIGAGAKSSVLGLHSWLPGSMEAEYLNNIIINILQIIKYNLLYILYILCIILILIFCLWIFTVDYNLLINKFHNFNNFNLSQSSINPILFSLTGSLLGDGHLRYSHKDKNGKPSGNAQFCFTQKSYDYIFYLYYTIYISIVTPSPPRPWPNPNTGLPIQQYTFNSRSTPFFSELYSQWYYWSEIESRFVKKLPSNIYELLNPLGLALWIMDDGYWNNTVFLCTDNFTLEEVNKLIIILESKFALKATINTKTRENSNTKFSYRIRISGVESNINLLRTLVKPFFIPSMLYKLGLTE